MTPITGKEGQYSPCTFGPGLPSHLDDIIIISEGIWSKLDWVLAAHAGGDHPTATRKPACDQSVPGGEGRLVKRYYFTLTRGAMLKTSTTVSIVEFPFSHQLEVDLPACYIDTLLSQLIQSASLQNTNLAESTQVTDAAHGFVSIKGMISPKSATSLPSPCQLLEASLLISSLCVVALFFLLFGLLSLLCC